MSQIDWVEQEADPDNNTAEKTAELVFVENDGGIGTKEISTVLTLVETDDDGNSEGDSETASAEETGEDASAEEEASSADTDDTASDAGENDIVEYQSGTLTAEGDRYRITLDYTEAAKIPENAELSVNEITPETDREAYEAYLEQAKKQVTGDDKSAVDETATRFFDIEIVSKGEKIEPKAPVQVIISHEDALDVSLGDTLSIVHFADEGTEVISDVTVSEDQKEISYEQASFSVVGEVKTNPTQGTENNPRQYALVVKYDGTYYSIDSDGTLTPVDVNDSENPTTVTLGSPMLWSYDQNGTIYHHTDATDVNAGQIAADFYYKYLDLNQEYGIYEEEKIDIKNDPATNHWVGQTKDGSDVILVVSETHHGYHHLVCALYLLGSGK